MTELIKDITDNAIRKAVRAIDDGGVICFPTDTVYALAADASSDASVEKIYNIKHRVGNKPLSVLVGDIYQAKRIVEFNENAQKLALKFFPGPLTLVLRTKENNNISKMVNKEIGTIGIRMPSHSLSLKIIKAVGRPIIGTSANLSGDKNATDIAQIIKSDMYKKIDLVFDQGPAETGVESTIVDLTSDKAKILRVGAISEEEIFDTLNK